MGANEVRKRSGDGEDVVIEEIEILFERMDILAGLCSGSAGSGLSWKAGGRWEQSVLVAGIRG